MTSATDTKLSHRAPPLPAPTDLGSDFAADVERYRSDGWNAGRALWWLTEPTIWAIAVYRLGRHLSTLSLRPARRPLLAAHALLSTLTQLVTGCELPVEATVAGGMRIYHGQNLVLNSGVRIGRGCTLRQGVTIGNVSAQGGLPVVGDDVEFGAYAQVLGDITIGDGARIGAHAVVLTNIPAGATAVGVPARIIQREGLNT